MSLTHDDENDDDFDRGKLSAVFTEGFRVKRKNNKKKKVEMIFNTQGTKLYTK